MQFDDEDKNKIFGIKLKDNFQYIYIQNDFDKIMNSVEPTESLQAAVKNDEKMLQKLQAINNLEHQLFDYKNHNMSCIYFDDDNVIDEVLKKLLVFSTETFKERKDLLKIIESAIIPGNSNDNINAPIKTFSFNEETWYDRMIDAYLNNFEVYTYLTKSESPDDNILSSKPNGSATKYKLFSFDEDKLEFKFVNTKNCLDFLPPDGDDGIFNPDKIFDRQYKICYNRMTSQFSTFPVE